MKTPKIINLSMTRGKMPEGIDPGECLGFEVIEKDIADQLWLNVDPQHSGEGNATTCATDFMFGLLLYSLDEEINDPSGINIFVTSRLDLDAVAAMCLQKMTEDLDKLQIYNDIGIIQKQVKRVHNLDCYEGERNIEAHVINQMLLRHRGDPVDMYRLVYEWLTTDLIAGEYIDAYFDMHNLITEEEASLTLVTIVDNVFAYVYGNAPGAANLAYRGHEICLAFAENYLGRDQAKYTLSVRKDCLDKYDLRPILNHFNAIEEGWDGNVAGGIIGSPMHLSSLMDPINVIEDVKEYVLHIA